MTSADGIHKPLVNNKLNGKPARRRSGKASNSKASVAFDLFAGAGGLSTGLEMAGFQVRFANEVSPVYSETLRQNHPGAIIATGDIREVDAEEVLKQASISPGELDLLAGGPPCQGFSINAPVRSTTDGRNHLFLEYLRFVETCQPKLILIENVPGIISFNGGETARAILERLRQLGYRATVRILYAPHFGVPQMRWRTIFWATRLDLDPLLLVPEPSHRATGRANFTTRLDGIELVIPNDLINKEATLPFTTVHDAIGDLPPIPNGGGAEETEYYGPAASAFQELMRGNTKRLTNHQCAGLGKANLVRLPHIPKGGSWRDIPFDLLPLGMKRARRSDHTKRYGRLHPEQLASTILTKCDPHWGTYIHPEQDRVLSVREAARIQSFPDRVRFYGSLSDQYEQVGNAVPPLLARAIGDRAIAALRSGAAP